MALNVEDVVKIPVQAWVEIAGVEFEAVSIELEYSADRAAARVTFATGVPLQDGVLSQVTAEQAKSSFALDTLVEIYVTAESNVPLPGLPTGRTLLLRGYIVDSGPWRIGGVGNEYGWGIEVLHRDIANLSTGSTAVWPLTTSVNFDHARPVASFDGQWISSMLSSSEKSVAAIIQDLGLWAVVQGFFERVAKGPDSTPSGDSLAGQLVRSKCTDESGTNETALTALGNIEIAEGVTLALGAKEDVQSFVTFLDQKLANDLRTMNFLQQIQAIADQCFFRMVPRADGSMFIVPFKTFEASPHVTFTSEEVFSFRPASIGDPRVSGILLYGTLITHSAYDEAYSIYGCYSFASDGLTISARGVMQAMPAPSWLGPGAFPLSKHSRTNFEQTPEASSPDANKTPPTPAEGYHQRLDAYGNAVAREWARQYRFRGSSASFSSYLRTDVGPQSTVKVSAPSTLGEETALFGKIDKVRILIDSSSKEAKTEYSLAYARNEDIQDKIGDYDHPIFSDGNWPGQAL